MRGFCVTSSILDLKIKVSSYDPFPRFARFTSYDKRIGKLSNTKQFSETNDLCIYDFVSFDQFFAPVEILASISL